MSSRSGSAMPDWFDATFGRGVTGAVLFAPDGTVERTNHAFRDLLGANSDLTGRHLPDLLSPLGSALEQSRQDSMRTGRKHEVRGVLLEPLGRDRRHLVDAELYPQFDGHGTVAGVLMVVHHRTGTSGDLAESARLFYQAFLHSTKAMELADRDGYLVDVNPAFERIYGYRREEVIGRRLIFFFIVRSY